MRHYCKKALMGTLLTKPAAKKAAGQAVLRKDKFSLRDHAQSYVSAEIKTLSEEQVRDVWGHFPVPVPLSCLVGHGSFSCLVVLVVVIVWLVLQPNTRPYELTTKFNGFCRIRRKKRGRRPCLPRRCGTFRKCLCCPEWQCLDITQNLSLVF